MEAVFSAKKVLAGAVLFDLDTQIAQSTAPNEGNLPIGGGVITSVAPLRADHWPVGVAPDGDYSNFGQATVRFDFAPQSWEGECINLSTVGYFTNDRKTAVGGISAEEFSLCDAADGSAGYTGPVQQISNERGRFSVLDFSACGG